MNIKNKSGEIGMTAKEKVMKGLECRATENPCKPPCNPMDCDYAEKVWLNDSEDYDGYFCDTRRIMADALALLKAQEPRVMTLEEVEEGKPYWLEMRGAASEYAICNLNDHGDSAFLDFATQFGYKTLENNGYGKTWRCWTARPADEQREAVKWE